MLFYEDLVKKIETGKIEDIKKIEKFGLNKAKNLVGYGIAIPLILFGLFEVYSYTIYHKWYFLLIGAPFFALGLKQAKTVFTYSIKVDTEAKNIKFKNLNLNFDDVESGTLKEMKLGKRVTPVIDMITNDKKQIVIPLFMAKQVRFILLIKEIT